jgi:AraC family transcriptional regulator
MSKAICISHGVFGRVTLLDMDQSLVRHAHPHCHVLLKVGGKDTKFLVGDRPTSLNDNAAVLVNAWQAHSYVHQPGRENALILALYIEPAWLTCFRPNWAASGGPGFFEEPSGEVTAQMRTLAFALAEKMLHEPAEMQGHESLLSDLMTAVIERFTPWRTVGASLRETGRVNMAYWRIKPAIDLIQGDVASLLNANFPS